MMRSSTCCSHCAAVHGEGTVTPIVDQATRKGPENAAKAADTVKENRREVGKLRLSGDAPKKWRVTSYRK